MTVGRSPDATLPLDIPTAPSQHPLFNLGPSDCLVDAHRDWPLALYEDEGTVDGAGLVAQGAAMKMGARVLTRISPGSRGSVTIGPVRLLFKWEAVPVTEVGEVPLADLGRVPRCHACGLALRDALAREGLLARCDACRAMNRFVDPEAPYRSLAMKRRLSLAEVSRLEPPLEDPLNPAAVAEERDTLLSVPIFAPTTAPLPHALPQHVRPAGRPGRDDTPVPLRIARSPGAAVEQMQTVVTRAPFVARPAVRDRATSTGELAARSAAPRTPPQEELLADAFYTAELEAMPLLPPESIITGDGERPVAWNTISVLSAASRYGEGEGRVPYKEVRHALEEAKPGWAEENAALIVAVLGVAVLAVGVLVVLTRGGRSPSPPPAPAAVEAPAAEAPNRVEHPRATYVRFEPGLPDPVSTSVDAFALDDVEATRARFAQFARETGAPLPAAWSSANLPDDAPATDLDFATAGAFCRWAGGRLPTETEWERAAVGTFGRMYPWGNTFKRNLVAHGPRVEPVRARPDGVSESGVFGLVGNAVEWVAPPAGEPPFLKGGGAGSFSSPSALTVFGRTAPDAVTWAPGPGVRCAYDL